MSVLFHGRNIEKRFGGLIALADVEFELRAGEVHGLVGSNGAGKSTLMRVLSGAVGLDAGTLELDGRPVEFTSPRDALAQGVAMVYQELSGVASLSVAENIVLGRQPLNRLGLVDWSAMNRRATAALAPLGLDLDVRRPLGRFPLAIRQLVEIARGLDQGARVLVLDEPTSALAPPDAERLHALVRKLAEGGVGVVFISHFLDEVLAVCDRVTVLRDGRNVATLPAESLTKHDLVSQMLGRETHRLESGYEGSVRLPPVSEMPPRLVCQGLQRSGVFGPVDLSVAPGECLALYGVLGAGHHELAEAIGGAMNLDTGWVTVDGVTVTGRIGRAIDQGLVMIAADRSRTVVRGATLTRNVTLAHLKRLCGWWVQPRQERLVAQALLDRVDCRPAHPDLPAGALSGGNQQKVVVARWLAGPVRALILQEPTHGMDVAAKDEVLGLVAELKRNGAAVLLATSEPELALTQGDRVWVMQRGRVVERFAGATVDKASLMRHA